MAKIFVEGDPAGIHTSELRITFAPEPAYRGNHGILTPSIVGRVRYSPEKIIPAYFPVRSEDDAQILGGKYVTFDRLAQYGSDHFVDVRDASDFYDTVHPRFRPVLGAKMYTLPSQVQDKEGFSTYRNLMMRDITRAAHDLLADYEFEQQELEDQNQVLSEQAEALGTETPVDRALRLAGEFQKVVLGDPAEMLKSYADVAHQFDRTMNLARLFAHLRGMSPAAQRHALTLPPADAWKEVSLDIQSKQRANYSHPDSATGG